MVGSLLRLAEVIKTHLHNYQINGGSAMKLTREEILKVLKNVIDPEIGLNIVDLGFIYGIDIKGKKIRVRMTLTTPECPMHQMFVHEVENALKAAFDKVEVKVELVFDPPWTPERMSNEAKKKLGVK
jgi:metal-sulfur cluster biosynthetic enzyme